VALIGVALLLHVSGRAISAGIGLALVPLIAVLFARWVDGPVLYYRSWGRLQQLPLSSVTAVSAVKPARGRRAIALSAPDLAKPLRISVQSRGYVMPSAARDHLRGCLSAPRVQWTPDAIALFDENVSGSSAARRRRWVRVFVFAVMLPLTGGGIGVWLAIERNSAFAIPGAPGYSTLSGPAGLPLALGRP
jgi:hypothetical protein